VDGGLARTQVDIDPPKGKELAATQAGNFFGPQGEGTPANYLFFSFTTLTTTGYGNLVPAVNPGQSLAVLEMIMGQLFLIAAVGKVIADWRPAKRGGQAKENAPG